MKILDKKPERLWGREAPNASPVACDCGEVFLHERGRGDRATCPRCKHEQTLNFAGFRPTPMTKVEAEGAEIQGPLPSFPNGVPPGHD